MRWRTASRPPSCWRFTLSAPPIRSANTLRLQVVELSLPASSIVYLVAIRVQPGAIVSSGVVRDKQHAAAFSGHMAQSRPTFREDNGEITTAALIYTLRLRLMPIMFE